MSPTNYSQVGDIISKMQNPELIYYLILSSATLVVSLYLIYFLLPLFKGAPFVRTSPEIVKKMINIAHLSSGDIMADLGSGDGRIIIAFAQAGFESHGYEINPFLVLWTKLNIRKAGLKDKAFVHCKSFWRSDFGKFNAITIFGGTFIMKALEKKLLKELPHNAKVLCNTFFLPNWNYTHKNKEVYLYEKI